MQDASCSSGAVQHFKALTKILSSSIHTLLHTDITAKQFEVRYRGQGHFNWTEPATLQLIEDLLYHLNCSCQQI